MERDHQETTPIEWIVGVSSLEEVTLRDAPSIRPSAVVLINADGFIVGARVVAPADVPSAARQILEAALAEAREVVLDSASGGLPAVRVRVASESLAVELRAAIPSVEVACAPTPELDEVFESMREHLAGTLDGTPSLLLPDVHPEQMGALFAAAAAVHRAAPWTIIPDGGCLIRVDVPEEGLVGGVLSVIGQAGESFGFLLFDDLEGYEAYQSMADQAHAEPDEILDPPPHLVLNFEHRDDLEPALLAEIESHGWEVNAPDGYPCPWIVDDFGEARSLMADEIELLEAVARALALLPALEPDLKQAWEDGNTTGVLQAVRVATAGGEIDVLLSVAPDYGRLAAPRLVASMSQLAEEIVSFESAGEDRAFELEAALARRFAESDKGRSAPETGSARLVLTLARIHLGESLANFDDRILETVLLELFPLKVSIDPSEAADVVAEVRAFFDFLLRECDLPAARRCLPLLTGDAGTDLSMILAEQLADPANYGPAKSMVMGARAAGVDFDDAEARDRWMLENSSRFLPPLPEDDRFAPGHKATRPKKTAKQRRKKRKQASKSRKRNR